MADVNISKYRASVVRDGSKPASPGFVVSEGQDPVNPPGTNNFVPYTGATANVELGEFGIEAGFVTLDTTPTNIPTDQGAIYWDDTRSTAALIMNGTLQHIGQDSFFYVKNSSGSTIPKGTCVGFAGTDGGSGHLLVTPFLANGSVPSTYFMGVTAESIANGSFGQVMHFGELTGINTSGFTAGALLYASSTVAGAFQTTAPVAPNNIILVAAAVNSKNNGAIVVRPTLGSNINSDEGVKITSPTTGDLLQLQAGGLWENKTLAQVIGSAYVPSTRTLTINGTAFDLSANRSWIVGDVRTDGSYSNPSWITALAWSKITGTPTTLSGYGITDAVPNSRTITINGVTQDLSANRTFNVGTVTSVGLSSATSGVTIGSTPVTSSGTITLAIATASGSQNGLLSSTDWTTFNNKQNALTNPVTGTGTTNYLPKFTGSTTIGNSIVTDNGSVVSVINGTLALSNAFNLTGRNAANTLNIALIGRNSSDRVVIDADGYGTNIGGGGTVLINPTGGNVGIGTASPSEKLDVIGVLRNLMPSDPLSGMITAKFLSFSPNPYGIHFRGYASGVHSIQVQREGNNSELFGLSLQPLGGNVLIGTTTDNGARLQVSGAGMAFSFTTSNGLIGNINSSAANGGYVTWQTNGTTIADLGTAQQIFGSGGNDTFGINGRGARALTFGTNNTERLRITSSGNVGIGTSSPNANLEVATANSLGSFAKFRLNAPYYNYWEFVNNSALEINRGGSTYLTISNVGNVGIGTSSPQDPLHISTSGTDKFIRIENSNSYTGIWMNDSGANSGWLLMSGYTNTTSPGDFAIREYGVQTSIVIKQTSGNVLIGTTTDNGARLQVSGRINATGGGSNGVLVSSNSGSVTIPTTGLSLNTGFNVGYLQNFNGGNYVDLYYGASKHIFDGGNVGIGTATFAYSPRLAVASVGQNSIAIQTTDTVQGSAGTILYLGTGSSTGSSTYGQIVPLGNGGTSAANLVLQPTGSNGNVLIGTTTDNGARLQVNGHATFSSYILSSSFLGTTDRLYIPGNRPVSDWFSSSLSAGYSQVNTYGWVNGAGNLVLGTDGAERMRINSSGNVGIGTTNPLQKLHITQASDTAYPTLGTGKGALFIAGDTNLYGLYVGINTNDGNTYFQAMRNNSATAYNITMQAAGGNVLIGTTTDVGARLHVNGDVRTAAPTGGSAVNWRLGTVRGGTVTPNATVRVEIGGVLVDLDARYV